MSLLLISIIIVVLATIAGLMALKVKSTKALIEKKEVEADGETHVSPPGPTEPESDGSPQPPPPGGDKPVTPGGDEPVTPEGPSSTLGGSLRKLFRG